MSKLYPLPYTGACIEGVRIMWVDGKIMRHWNLPFWEYMKRTGPYNKTEEQKNAIIIQLNTYYGVFCKAHILENIK